MADSSLTQPRALAPRRLEQKESLQSLNHWRSVFRNYYRRCQYYGIFLLPTTTWDNTENRGFTTAETTGLKRNVQTLAADLAGFLDCIGSYLPFDYVSEKLQAESSSIQSVWDLIYELYDAEISTSNFLDYGMMQKLPDETYRSFYNRLVGFIRQHLPKEVMEVEGVIVPRGGEHLTVALLDTVAMHWLLCIDKRLLNIIKTEFATDLKTKRLCQLVKQISQNIDELLVRYDNKDQVVMIKPEKDSIIQDAEANGISSLVRRLEKLEAKSNKQSRKKKSSYAASKSRPLQCTHCTFLNRQLNASLRTDHHSSACGKRSVSISLLESMDVVEDLQTTDSSPSDSQEGEISSPPFKSNLTLQRTESQLLDQAEIRVADSNRSDTCVSFVSCPDIGANRSPNIAPLSDTYLQNQHSCIVPTHNRYDSSVIVGNREMQINDDKSCFTAAISTLQSSTFPWNSLDKSSSPRIKCRYNNLTFSALIDSGAEINVLDRDFASSLSIGIVKSNETARAANKLLLDVCGQTSLPIEIECLTETGSVMLKLGIMLVIANLGTKCLLGEPAKLRNNLICLPRQKMVIIANGPDVKYAPYDEDKPKYSVARSISSIELKPGEQILYQLPESLSLEPWIAVSPRADTCHWLQPSIQQPRSGTVYLTNSSHQLVRIKKSDHIADLRDSTLVDAPVKPLPGKAIHPDVFQFSDFASSREICPDYLKQIKVDPDNVLSSAEKSIFHSLHKRFASLFTPQPGRYNGKYGYIDNKLQFATPPPPNTKTRVPNYSPTMNGILAEKMDLLEKWGVLAEPELLGISVEYISPSMLVPKPEKGEYRVVTDFSSLNVYLKKVPNTSATIAQAKARIARANFVIHLDLANYFYQNGLQLSDTKYLGTIHPFKGVRIYTCDPQGLKGASERSYAKLA